MTEYEIRQTWDFDPDNPGLPPGNVVDAFEYAAAHSGLRDETWELVDKQSGEVLAELDIGGSDNDQNRSDSE